MAHTKGHITTSKSLVKYSKSKALLQKVKHIGSKASGEQRFLGKTLPKALWKVAKWGFKHPITATALTFAPKAISKMASSLKGIKHPEFKQFNKKGRKVFASGSYRRGTRII